MKKPNIHKLKFSQFRERHIEIHYPEFYEKLLKHNFKVLTTNKFSEKLYLYINKMEEPPKCVHPDCDNYSPFLSRKKGYQKYCCQKCSENDPYKQEKNRKTSFEHYGTKYPWQSEEIKDKIKQTNLEKYGVENPSQSKEIQEKMRLTNLKKYNVDNIFKLPNFYEKYCNTIQPTSKAEIELQDYIEQLGYQIVRNTRDIIKGYELDIYIPNLNIAIEYNGSYWHSIINKEPKYHMNKWKACYSAGIELISIWEPWNIDIVHRFLKDKLKGSDIRTYKKLLFLDLNDNKWPLDLGYLTNHKINLNKIKEHICIYNGYECYDSGILK